MTLQEKYIAIQEGTFPKSQFKRDAVLTLPNLVTTFNTYEEVITILKNKGILTEVLNEYGTSDYFNEYEDAVKYAEDISSREGVVQHVNELPDGTYKVSDWYDSDTTVISFENGRELNEGMADIKWASDGGYYTKPENNNIISKEEATFINNTIEQFKRDIVNSEKPILVDNTERGKINMEIINNLMNHWNVKFENDSEEGTDFFWLSPNQNIEDVKDGLEYAWQLFYDKVESVNEQGDQYVADYGEDENEYFREKNLKRKVLPNKNRFTSDTISIKSALERIIQKAWAEPVLEKAKIIVLDFINTSRINDNSKKTMISNIESINNKPRLDSYLANALLAFEKLKVNEELLKYKETKVSKYGTTLTAPEDSYSFEDVQRGVDYELESMGYDSASPETFTEVEVEKAKKKVLSNLDKNRLYYLNLLAGENNTTDKHDKYTSVKKDNTVDTFNKMKKAELKEAIKKIIVNTFQPSTGILIENRLQRMWEVGRAYPGYGKALKVEGERNKVTVEFHTGTSHLFEIDSESGIWKEVKTPIIENLDPEKYEYMDSLVTVKALQALRKAGAIIVRELEDENFEIRDILQFIVDNIKTEYGIN
jgi:hypothetical protein